MKKQVLHEVMEKTQLILEAHGSRQTCIHTYMDPAMSAKVRRDWRSEYTVLHI